MKKVRVKKVRVSDADEKNRLRVAEERLMHAEQVSRMADEKSFVLVPICAKNVTRAAFIRAVADSKTELVHREWPEAMQAARDMSEHGAFELVYVFSRKTKSRMLGTADNGRVK